MGLGNGHRQSIDESQDYLRPGTGQPFAPPDHIPDRKSSFMDTLFKAGNN